MGPLFAHLRLFALLPLFATGIASSVPYYGARVGKFSTHFHDVKGDVYAVDDKALYIKNFNYDGRGADAVFWAGSSIRPDSTGFIIPHNIQSDEALRSYHDQDLILHLPEGRKVIDIRWLSVWSRKYPTSFGSVIFPKSLTPPRPVVIGRLNNTKEASSGDILILDSQTFLVPDFNYHDSGKGVHWWLSRGRKPNMGGLRLTEEDESDLPLQEHKNKTVIVTMPDGHSIFEYHLLSLWSPTEVEDYGTVEIPEGLNIPPSPRALGLLVEVEGNKLNCEMLNDNLGLEVRWLINGNDIILHLVGNIEESEYMILGLSKDDTETRFDAADAVVAWIDKDGNGHAVDYYLESTEICDNGHGMCPDDVHEGFGNNLLLLKAKKFGNTTVITFKRPLKAEDQSYDQNIYTDGPQAVLWAVGPLQGENLVGPPKLRTRGNLLLDFGRDPNWNCPPPKEETSSSDTTDHNNFEIRCPRNHLFRAQMGPSTRKNINVWYMNGLPTPELTVQRGQEYTFIVEGGMGPANRNPLYITNSSEGGFYQNLPEASDSQESLFAGVHKDAYSGIYLPTSEGRLCQWSFSDTDPEHSITTSLSDSVSALTIACEPGNYAKLVWTPDADTPSYVYYQSFTKKNLGGRIKVLDFCAESNPDPYVENDSSKSDEKSSIKGHKFKPGLEVESDSGDSEHISSFGDNEKEINLHERVNSNNEEPQDNVLHKNKMHTLEEMETYVRIENQRIASLTESDNSSKSSEILVFNHTPRPMKSFDSSLMMDEPLRLEISQPLVTDPLHPHDESERSDKNIHQNPNSEVKKKIVHNRIPVGAQSSFEKLSLTTRVLPAPSNVASHNEQPQITRQTASRFKPQFEGGFVPLVLNPIKEKESALSKEFDYPPLHLRRPHRPFLFNESIPFHGTFKPGVPDFSGFNISHYSQDDSPYLLNHVLDNLPMLSAPNPQVIQRPITSMNGLPSDMFQRQKGSIRRPQIFGYAPRVKDPGFGYYQQPPVLTHLSNIRIPNSPEEELAEVSSQRVQVALQASGDDKGKQGVMNQFQMMRGQERKYKNKPQPNNLVHAPPIQRRPDFVGEGETPVNPTVSKPTHTNNYPGIVPVNVNKNVENQRIPPAIQHSGLQNPFGIRRPVPLAKVPFNGRDRDNSPHRVPSRGFHRQTYPFVQGPHREILPPFPGKQIENPNRQRNPPFTELKVRDSAPNIGSHNKLHPLPQTMNPESNSEESIEEDKSPEEFGPLPSKEQEIFPLFLHPEVLKHSDKNSRPQVIAMGPKNPMNVPGLLIPANRHHVSPMFFNKEVKVQKLPIPLRDSRPQSIVQHKLPLQVNPLSPGHSLNQKEENHRNKYIHDHPIKDSNGTASQISDSVNLESSSMQSKKDMKEETHLSEFEVSGFEEHLNETQNDTTEHQIHLDEEQRDSDSTDIPIEPEYIDYDVPFGARLKPNDGSSKPKTYRTTNRPTFPRKPQLISSVVEKKIDIPISLTDHPEGQHTNQPTDSDDRTNLENNQQKDSDIYESTTSSSQTSIKLLNEENSLVINSDFKNNSSDPQKFVALFLDNVALEKHHGRKNILPNASESSPEPLNIPPKVPENINLPQISEHPPSNDNGTDYSILNHVLSLIGGPSGS